jgi:two-component system, response regulator YesN
LASDFTFKKSEIKLVMGIFDNIDRYGVLMKKILIIEDDKRLRIMFKRLLEKRVHAEILEAENGVEGFKIYEQEKPRLIFCDIDMPVMNGIQFVNKVREKDNETYIIILSGFSEKQIVQKVIELGVNDYILKTDLVMQLWDRVDKIFKKNMYTIFSN